MEKLGMREWFWRKMLTKGWKTFFHLSFPFQIHVQPNNGKWRNQFSWNTIKLKWGNMEKLGMREWHWRKMLTKG